VLNKQKGNMFEWVTHTWNPVKGVCPHRCSYCYMRYFLKNEIRPYLDEKCFRDDLGKGNVIFVGSSIDLFAEEIPSEWIEKVLRYCRKFPENTYLFQSKNPARFKEFEGLFPPKTILGTTLETNRDYKVSRAPLPKARAKALAEWNDTDVRKTVTIEPVMDFDLKEFVSMIASCRPDFVSVGAFTGEKNSPLPEPSQEKLVRLISELKKFTKVRLKKNLFRLLGTFQNL